MRAGRVTPSILMRLPRFAQSHHLVLEERPLMTGQRHEG